MSSVPFPRFNPYEEEDTALRRLSEHLNAAPTRQEFAPSLSDKISAALVGGSFAIRDPELGLKESRRMIDRPYDEAFSDWKNRGLGLEGAAKVEQQANLNRQRAMQAVAMEMYRQGMLEDRGKRTQGYLDNLSNLQQDREIDNQRNDIRDKNTENYRNQQLGLRKQGLDLNRQRTNAYVDKTKQGSNKGPTVLDNARAGETALKELLMKNPDFSKFIDSDGNVDTKLAEKPEWQGLFHQFVSEYKKRKEEILKNPSSAVNPGFDIELPPEDDEDEDLEDLF